MGSFLPTATVLAEFRNIQNIMVTTAGSEPIAVDFKGTELRMVKHLYEANIKTSTKNCHHTRSFGKVLLSFRKLTY